MTEHYPPISDYAIIGDCRSAALVSCGGSIDWLCLPRFDSPALFGALLDAERGGRFRIAPVAEYSSTRRYIGQSNVLETTFKTNGGTCRLVDAMPVADEPVKARELWPEHELLRSIEVVDGEVEVEVRYEPRFEFARGVTRIHTRPQQALLSERGRAVLVLRSEIPLRISPDATVASGRRSLRAGERAVLGLSFTHGAPAVLPPVGDAARALIAASVDWWERWVAQCPYDWHYRDHVIRSALTLKLLTYSPSGAIIAAPTTSLPEQVGGVRNWDYRYCWLRDASLTLRALLDLGFTIEAESFLSWLLHSTRLTRPRLQILYDVYGESRLTERALDHLEGYRGSRPVRIGNNASGQLQLDVYGEVIDAAYQYVVRGGHLDRATSAVLFGFGRTVCEMWTLPDEGIWEPRSGRRHNTHSKAMCWLALDRLVRLAADGHVRGDARRFAAVRDEIRQTIERDGWSARLASYVAAFGTEEVDAALLRLALCGYADPRQDRMRATAARIRERLSANGLLYRYLGEDGLPGAEGTFGICSFWGAECCALQGQQGDATRWFESLLKYTNDVGLLSEEIDPRDGRLLGNFPQAFTHVGLINAAFTLAERAGHPQWQPAATGEKKV